MAHSGRTCAALALCCCYIKIDVLLFIPPLPFSTKDLLLFPQHVLIEVLERREILSNSLLLLPLPNKEGKKNQMKTQPFYIELMVK